MSNTDRIRAYYNLHKKCFSVQDYKTGLVIEHTNKLCFTNAMFVVRKSGNERVKQEGKKNVHAFVNGIRQPKWITPHLSYQEVKYNPHTMDYFKYKRVMTTSENLWLDVDRHWIGDVWLFMLDGKPCIYADIDKLSGQKLSASASKEEPIHVKQDEHTVRRYYPNGGFSIEFLERKKKIIENKNKLLAI
jgi:hypothetical protein